MQFGVPAISTNAAIIDGYSQPGASKNTLAQGDNAKLVIALDGSSLSVLRSDARRSRLARSSASTSSTSQRPAC